LTPYRSFATSDGYLIIACGNDGPFKQLCAVLGEDHLPIDPRFIRMADRNVNWDVMIERLSQIFVKHPSSHWLKALEHSGLPNGSINTYDKVFKRPRVVHPQLNIEQQHVNGGTVATARNPIRLSDTQIEYRFAPPVRAQHTEDIPREVLGIRHAQIQALQEINAVKFVTKTH